MCINRDLSLRLRHKVKKKMTDVSEGHVSIVLFKLSFRTHPSV